MNLLKKLLPVVLLLCALAVGTFAQTAGNTVRWHLSDEIDCTATGTYLIGTTRDDSLNLSFYPIKAFVVMTGASNVLVPAVFSIGANSSSYNNIVLAGTAGAAGGITLDLDLLSQLPNLPEGTEIKVKFTSAATGISPTCTCKVGVLGIERPL